MIKLLLILTDDSENGSEALYVARQCGFRDIDIILSSDVEVSTAGILHKVYEKLKGYDSQVTLVLNAFRSVVVHPPERLLYKYSELGYDVVFSANYSGPLNFHLTSLCYDPFRSMPFGDIVFNGIIGRSDKIAKFLEDYGVIYNKPNENCRLALGLSVAAAINSGDDSIALDYMGCLFSPGVSSIEDPELIEIDENLWYDKRTCALPSVIARKIGYPELLLPAPEKSVYYALDEVCLALMGKREKSPIFEHRLRYETRTLLWYEKANVIARLAKYLSGYEGDLVEIGVYKGGGSKIILDNSEVGELFAFDTYEGLPEPTDIDREIDLKGGDLSDTSCEDVKAYLDSARAHVIKGLFPKSKPRGFSKRKLKFVHIDVDFYESTLKSLKAVYPMLINGGIIVFDDYSFRGVQTAIHEYIKKNNLTIFCPRGADQAILIKNEKN